MKEFNWKDKNVLITGIYGFVGSNLTKYLIKKKANVYGVYKKNSTISLLNIEKIKNFNSVQLTNNVNENTTILSDLIFDKHIDICFHLAAQVEVLKALKEPYDTFNNNINLSLSLFESVKKTKLVKTIIHCSTDKVYGNIDKKKLPYKEYYSPNPIYPYDVSKYVCELIGQSYFDNYKIPIITTRTSNLYGPGQLNFSALIPYTIKVLNENKEFIPRSNGLQERDYLFIDDWIYYLEKLTSVSFNKNIFGNLYNFGNNDPINSKDIVKEIYRIFRKRNFNVIENKFSKFKSNKEIEFQSIDMSKAKRIIGFKKTKLRIGLKKTIDWFDKFYFN